MMVFFFFLGCFPIMVKTFFFYLDSIFFSLFTEIACDYSGDCIGLVYPHA
jgi:hypothetical protein